jgi:hypothetical protein
VTRTPAFESVFSTLSLAAVLISLPVATRVARAIGIAFLATRGFLLWFGGGGLNAFVQSFGQMAYVLGLFAVLPVLAAPIRLGGYSNAIQNLLQTRVMRASAQTGPLLFLLLMPVMTLAASFIGMHPLVTIALLGSVLSQEVLGVSATRLALSLIGSTVIAFMLGPFTGTLGLVQTLSKTSVFRLAWWSAPYGLGYFCVLCAFIVMS